MPDDPVVVAGHADRTAAVGADAGDRGAAPDQRASPPLEPPLVRAGRTRSASGPELGGHAIRAQLLGLGRQPLCVGADHEVRQSGDDRCVLPGDVTLAGKGAGTERQAGHADRVLDRERQPEQRRGRPSGAFGVGLGCGGERRLPVERSHGVQVAGGLDARERRLGQLDPRQLAGLEAPQTSESGELLQHVAC